MELATDLLDCGPRLTLPQRHSDLLFREPTLPHRSAAWLPSGARGQIETLALNATLGGPALREETPSLPEVTDSTTITAL
jgi:hypothetical protein